MHLICNREELLKGIQIVEAAVSSRVTLPVLANILLETEKESNRLKLVTTDLEIAVRCYVATDIKKEGGVTIPAKKFANIIKELPDKNDKIELKVDEKNQIDIRAGKSHFVLFGTAIEQFPTLPGFVEEKAITVETETMKEMIKKISFAASMDDTRYILTGIYIIIESEKIIFVATDGKRLSYITRPAKGSKTISKAIIPSKATNELVRILSIGDSNEIKISITGNQASFQTEDITLISRLLEGNFPNYEQVIPKKCQQTIKVKSKDLLQATRQVALLTQEKGGSVKFAFDKNLLNVSTKTQELGSADVEIEIDYSAPPLEIAFNHIFIIDILKNISEQEVIFEINGPIDACVVKAVGDENYLNVIMPMRV
ncbi:MAG: DNA polymerase III subunit beta [Elusimicrobiota bacterium]